MSSIGEVNLQKPFSFESHKRNYKCLKYIQVALVTITAVGIVLSVVSHFGYLDHVFIKIGIGVAVPSFAIGPIVLYFRRQTLEKAIQATTSFAELKEILQESKLRERIYDYDNVADIYSKVLGGYIKMDELNLKIEQLKITNKEESEAKQYIEKFPKEAYDWVGDRDCIFTENGEMKT